VNRRADVQKTPMAFPLPSMIGEPDIPLFNPKAAPVTHSGPPAWPTVQPPHFASSDSNHAVDKFLVCVELLAAFLVVRRTQDCDICDWINKIALRPNCSVIAAQRSGYFAVRPFLQERKRHCRRQPRQAVSRSDDIASLTPLHYEAAAAADRDNRRACAFHLNLR
jgi:hypothetical protein